MKMRKRKSIRRQHKEETDEVDAVLSECREEDDSCATLARLKMAIEYEEKKVSNETVAVCYDVVTAKHLFSR